MDRDPLEVVTNRLYALGGMLELDGRISWVPFAARGFQPVNCFLLVEDRNALLVDTGLPIHGEAIVKQLQSRLPKDAHLSIFLTRPELDCLGNLGIICERFEVKTVFSGGYNNPFDSFDQVSSMAMPSESPWPNVERILPGQAIALSTVRRLDVLTAPLRMLTSFWAYDTGTATLFTSDIFGCPAKETARYQPVVSVADDTTTMESLREYSQARFWWLPRVTSTVPAANLEAIFSERDIAVVAPTHGGVVLGRELVSKHFQLFHQMLPHKAPEAGA